MTVARRKYIDTLEAAGYGDIAETVTSARVEGDTVVCTVELRATRTVTVPATIKQGKADRQTTKAERKAALKAALEATDGKGN